MSGTEDNYSNADQEKEKERIQKSYSEAVTGSVLSQNVITRDSASFQISHKTGYGEDSHAGDQGIYVVFHLYVNKNAENASLQFEKPLKYNGNLILDMTKISSPHTDGKCTYFRSRAIYVHAHEIESSRYKYFVKYAPTFAQTLKSLVMTQNLCAQETRFRKVFGGPYQYDVFKDPDNCICYECIFRGQFFFVKMLYDQIEESGRNLKEILIESERVGFGHPKFLIKEKKSFFSWVISSTKTYLTPQRSAFLCALLGHFYIRCRVPFFPSTYLTDYKQITDCLLVNLRGCNKEHIPKSSVDFIKRIDLSLLMDSSFASDLGYVLNFCHLFDRETLLERSKMLVATKNFDEIAQEVVDRIMQLGDEQDKGTLIRWVIEHTPNVSSLWKLTKIVEKEISLRSQTGDCIAAKFTKFFSPELYKTPDVFDETIWQESPYLLRGKLAVPFAKALKHRVEAMKFDENKLIDLMLDRDIQSGACSVLLDIMNVLSKAKKHLDVACSILKSDNFLSFWEKCDKGNREEIIWHLASSKVKFSSLAVPARKDEVVKGCQVYEELCEIDCLMKHQDLVAKCICHELQRCGLKSIVDAYDEIQRSLGDIGKHLYLTLLANTVKVEQAKPDVKSKLIDSIFPTTDLQSLAIDGGREEILVLLLNQTKPPTKPSTKSGIHRQMISSVISIVLSQRTLWKTVFQATGKVERLQSHPTYLAIKEIIDSLRVDINNGHIPLHFVKNEKDLKDISLLLSLGRCYPRGYQSEVGLNALQGKWLQFLDSLSKEKEELQERFWCLRDAIDLADDTAKRSCSISVVDHDAICKEYYSRKRDLKSTTFSDIRDQGYWGPLEPLITPSEELKMLSKSKLFKTFGQAALKEYAIDLTEFGEDQDFENDENVVNEHRKIDMTIEGVLVLLKTEVLKSFTDAFKRVGNEDSTITSQELDKLLANIEKSQIEKECKDVSLKLQCPSLSANVLKMLRNFIHYDDVKRNIQAAMECLNAVGYANQPDSSDCFQQTLRLFLNCKESGTLRSISEHMEEPAITRLSCQLSPDLVDTLNELSCAKELIEFIITTAKDNMVDLVEAVEEHSDQLIQEATVSYLIDVHRFLRELLSNKPDKPETFLKKICKAYIDNKKHSADTVRTTKMATKIKVVSCNVHSLRGLHMMLSNRGEMTKEIIKSAVNNGQYLVRINLDGTVEVQLKYTRQDQKKSEAKYNLDELNDLRSRALLMVNADKAHVKTFGMQTTVISLADLKYFVDQIDLLTDIVRNYVSLKISGKPEYATSYWKLLESMDEIKEEEERTSHEVESWNAMIFDMRRKYFFLNFFHTKYFWLLKSFFHNNSESNLDGLGDVLALFRCIDINVNEDDLSYFRSQYARPSTSKIEDEVHAIGSALEKIFRPSLDWSKPVLKSSIGRRDAVVQPSQLYVCVLDPDSSLTVHVIMALYESTCSCLPKPSQLLFCSPRTTWSEIELLLFRTFEAHKHGLTSNLHCIANVECLPSDIQFKLVDTLRNEMTSDYIPYLLSIVCRGGPHHHIADQFSDYVHYHSGIPDADMRTTFGKMCPDAFLVTGDLPGLGKTEEICSHASEKEKAPVTFPISGPFVRADLVKRLSELKLKFFQAIHFDIGEVNDPAGLDTFLFELVVTKMVSSETLMFSLPTGHIYIEIANTLQQGMRNSLPVCKCFKRLKVGWKEYSNVRRSEELTSPIQIVCHYLNAYANGNLEHHEVNLSGKDVKPLSTSKCQALLKKHFFPGGDLSFNILENFLSVLGYQLLKFSRSPYFKPMHLKDMIGPHHDIRIRLFKALLEVSTSFAARSINTCKATQADAISETQAKEALEKMKSGGALKADEMVDRVKGMIQWSDNQQLVIMLHGAGAITAIYKDLKDVPQKVKELFKSQAIHGNVLEDYSEMTQKELQSRLEMFSDAPIDIDRKQLETMNYALTPDNLLKMALIIQRMQAGIPVLIMGETGCGKTSLVRYLAQTCSVPFEVFSFHAGITEKQIVDFIFVKDKEARNLRKEGKSMWVFLDEINTCDYLGTINEIVCHRSFHGRPLAPNLMFVAACNPYRLRPQGSIMTAGLTGKTTFDEFSKLVYRVHPLPETMIDYVWDYGSLSRDDEMAYISRMVEKVFEEKRLIKALVDLLTASQDFIRCEDKSSFCVSLRDVHRATILMRWFYGTLKSRPFTSFNGFPSHIRKYFETARRFAHTERAIVLALAHCYLSRLPTTSLRKSYCQKMTDILVQRGFGVFSEKDSFQHIIRAEQEDYLRRMELPDGTAKNAALRENVFVLIVCILNRIPVFVVGKPGCSKSLSMQIIRSNLRGRDSKDPFLKTLSQLMVLSFQGSESSTSEGIEKVFEKARKYKNKAENVLPVVLLDEIGLAEVSKFNPLKVLHRLLEPGDGQLPDVAVVGISNWALDAAKMNRAIHLSRPEPDKDDLFETGLSIRNAQSAHVTRSLSSDPQIRCLAEAYHEYQAKQKHENFHGLRDYYSMVKCLSSPDPAENSTNIQRAMQRNFGGITAGKGDLQLAFLKKLQSTQTMGDVVEFHVNELIQDNLDDRMARHLMLLTSGDSALGILEETLKDLNKEKVTIFGSHFEEDLSPDYSHRILSRIILCMESNCVLILRDLERIYGSLYDMLNQNYMVVGGKKNCRVALGAFSNPMCQVDDGFRCIVLVDENKVDYSDPPFLNRFEKQLLRYSDVLDERQRMFIKELSEWTKNISSIQGHETQFDEFDMFAGFHEDTLPSIVLLHSKDAEKADDEVLDRCKEDLMSIAMPDAVIRSRNSKLHQINDEEVNYLYQSYFEKPTHDGLKAFLEHTFEMTKKNEDDSANMKLIVMTHSSIHNDVSKAIEGLFMVQTEKLSFFKSEKEISKRIKYFYLESSSNLLIVQCRPETDAPHMLLVKAIIEEQRQMFICSCKPQKCEKHVCIIMHLRRSVEEECNHRWQFNFLSGWSQVMIECLEKPAILIREMLEYSVIDILGKSETIAFNRVACDQFLWCFTRIKFPNSKPPKLDTIASLVNAMTSSPEIMNFFMTLCCNWIERQQEDSNMTWQINVACDRQALINSSNLAKAMEYYIVHLVRLPLVRIVYFLQKHSAFQALTSDNEFTRQECLKLMSNDDLFKIDEIPPPQGAESLVVDMTYADLRFPFSNFLCEKIDSLFGFFQEEKRKNCLELGNIDENENISSYASNILVRRIAMKVEQIIDGVIESKIVSQQLGEYADDFLDMKTDEVSDVLSRHERIAIMKGHYGEKMPDFVNCNPINAVAQLHCIVWDDQNAIPQVFFFIKNCISLNIPCFEVKHLISRYNADETRIAIPDDDSFSKWNDEGTEPMVELGPVEVEPVESGALDKLPEENSEKEPIQNEEPTEYSIQEREQHLDDAERRSLPSIPEGQLVDKDESEEMVLDDVEGAHLQQRHGVNGENVDEIMSRRSTNTCDNYIVLKWNDEGTEPRDELGLIEPIESDALDKLPEGNNDKEPFQNEETTECSIQESVQYLEDAQRRSSLSLPEGQLVDKDENEEMVLENLEVEHLPQRHGVNDEKVDEERMSRQSTNDLYGSHKESTSILDDDGFDSFLVEEVCLVLLPTDELIHSVGGLSKWKNAVNLVLSSVTKYCNPLPISYFLKVCNDFASLIPPEKENEAYSLFEFGERGKQVVDHSYLDSSEIFHSVRESVQILREKEYDGTKLDEFLFQFYERCIESNPDTPMIGEILSRVSLSEDENMLHLASSILHQIILSENEAFSSEHLEQLITCTELDEFPNLLEINFALGQVQENGKELDCHVNVICCDLINRLAFKDLQIKQLSGSDDPRLRHFHKAVCLLSETDESLKMRIFGFLCAVAYLRAFISELVRLLSGDQIDCLDLVLNDICTHLQNDQQYPNRKSALSTFLVKELCQVMCFYDARRLIESHDKFHFLILQEWVAEDTSKLEFNPFKMQTDNSHAKTALGLFVESKNPKPFIDALYSIIGSFEQRKGLAAIVIEMFYILRSQRMLNDTDGDLAEFIISSLTKITYPFKAFLSRITSRESFHSKELEISPQSTAIDLQVAVLIQHLSATLTSCFSVEGKNPIMCCLVHPKQLEQSHVVAMSDDDSGYQKYKNFKGKTAFKSKLFSCKCNTRFVTGQSAETKCPCCDAPGKEDVNCKEEKNPSMKGYVSTSPDILKCDMLYARNLHPVEFRILHLIVHAALMAGYSLGLSTDVLRDVMGNENPSDACYNIVQIDLDVLSRLLCYKKEKVVTLLHHIIASLTPFLTQNAGLPLPHDDKGRSFWESHFAKEVQPLVQKFHRDGFVVKDGDISYKSVLEEHDLPQFSDIPARNMSIPRLFRFTQPNTFNKLREVYLNSPREVKERHQLLGLFLDHSDTLHQIGNLVSLLTWSRRVESLLSRAITRKDAKEKKIYDTVICRESEALHQARLTEIFEEFKKAWRRVVPLVNESIKDGDQMPYISEMNPVGYCLAEKKELGKYLCKSFVILANMQNKFLDDCLCIASTGKCPALQFLCKERSCYYLPIVHVQDAKEREIIRYEWTDEFLAHSHCATEYGQGKNITYDMTKIEKDMAGCFLLGKVYLDTSSGIREFVFSKQLFHDCANILNELCEAIPQDKLPGSVEAELNSSARKSMDRIQTLLEHMELVLCYLKRMKVSPDRSLVEFSDTCIPPSRVFPKDLLPTTINLIYVKHVCALYEYVEDQLAVPSVECVEEKYLKKIHGETKAKLEAIGKGVAKAHLEAVITAIKRFVFRYLHMTPHPDESLLEFMKDPSLWPMALRVQCDGNVLEISKAAPKFFPVELKIGEIYEVHAFYEDLLKELNAKLTITRTTGLATVPRPTRTVNRPVKKRRSKAGGYS